MGDEFCYVIGKQCRLVASAGDGDVGEARIEQIGMNARVGMNEHAVGGEALGAMTGDRIAVVEMTIRACVEFNVTAAQLVYLIESLGGTVALSSDNQRVRCRLPRSAENLVDEVRLHRNEILELLRENSDQTSVCASNERRPQLADLVSEWLKRQCVTGPQFASNPKILHREFSRWAEVCPTRDSEDVFIHRLQKLGFPLDDYKMLIGLALTIDIESALEYEREVRARS